MSEGKKEILLGDCLELMKDIPNGSIDMILCDLPYGTTSCKWDTIIPFDKLWEQYERIIKPNGAIILFGSEPFSSSLRMSNIDIYRYDVVWNKVVTNGSVLCHKRPMKQFENIIVFYKKQPKYTPQMKKRDKSKYRKPRNMDKWSNNVSETMPTKRVNQTNYSEEYMYPSDIIEINCKDKELNTKHKIHPTQKPVLLFEYLIKTYTNEGELVLDNTAGSGTTAIACLKTNRQFIVMEKEQKYYDIILKRVGDFNKNFEQQTLFGSEM